MKQLIYFLVAIALFSCKQNPESLNPESIYHVKSKWEKQDGSKIYLSHFKGKVVVTSMIFTACKTACPRLSMEMKNISKKMKQAIKTYKNMENYIANSFDYEYSNGIVEGINNVIKQIKHTACGYKKFNHLKARVMLIKGILNPINS